MPPVTGSLSHSGDPLPRPAAWALPAIVHRRRSERDHLRLTLSKGETCVTSHRGLGSKFKIWGKRRQTPNCPPLLFLHLNSKWSHWLAFRVTYKQSLNNRHTFHSQILQSELRIFLKGIGSRSRTIIASLSLSCMPTWVQVSSYESNVGMMWLLCSPIHTHQ